MLKQILAWFRTSWFWSLVEFIKNSSMSSEFVSTTPRGEFFIMISKYWAVLNLTNVFLEWIYAHKCGMILLIELLNSRISTIAWFPISDRVLLPLDMSLNRASSRKYRTPLPPPVVMGGGCTPPEMLASVKGTCLTLCWANSYGNSRANQTIKLQASLATVLRRSFNCCTITG